MRMRVQTTCPYCKRTNTLVTKYTPAISHSIVLCDVHSGGCDQHYVVVWHVTVIVDNKKIEGQGTAAKVVNLKPSS